LKKRVAILLFSIVPLLSFANPSEQEKMMQEMMTQMKKQMLTMFEGMLPVMKESRGCLNGANSKTQAEKCSVEFSKKYKKLLDNTGFGQFAKGEGFEKEFITDNFEWNAKTKKETLDELDKAINSLEKGNECLKKYDSLEAMEKCQEYLNTSM